MERFFAPKPRVFFEVEKVIDVSSDGNVRSYRVQWAPAWVSSLHLIGCEHLIEEFLQHQSSEAGNQQSEVIPPDMDSADLHNELPAKNVAADNSIGNTIEIVYPSDSVEFLQQQRACENMGKVVYPSDSIEFLQQPNQETEEKEEGEVAGAPHGERHTIPHSQMERNNDINSDRFDMRLDVKDDPHITEINDQQIWNKSGTNKPEVDYKSCENEVCNDNSMVMVVPEEEYDSFHDSKDNNEVSNNGLYDENTVQLHSNGARKTFYPPPLEAMQHDLDDNIPFKRKCVYQCESCDKAFAEKRYLIKHKKRMHPEEEIHDNHKKLQCQYCPRSFRANCDLVIHIRTHTNERPYKCEFCNKSFTRKDILTEHIWTHTKDRPYKCNLCNRSYNRKYLLENHQQKKHANEYHSMAMTM